MKIQEVDSYIARFDGITKERLVRLRELAHKNIPDAYEKISYGVPTICDKNGKYIAYFAGYKDFVSIYPVHLAGVVEKEIQQYISGRSTARFQNKDDLPEELIKQIYTSLYESF